MWKQKKLKWWIIFFQNTLQKNDFKVIKNIIKKKNLKSQSQRTKSKT